MGIKATGALGTTDPTSMSDPTDENPTSPDTGNTPPTLTAADVKKLPWVQNALKDAAEFKRLQASLADEAAAKEREKLSTKAEFDAALKVEQDRVAALQKDFAEKERLRDLSIELIREGAKDPRLVKIFGEDYDPGTETAAEFVARIKKDELNAGYFASKDPAPTRRKVDPPPNTNNGGGGFANREQAQAARKSPDPEVRRQAGAWLSADWAAAHPKPPQ